MAATNQPLIKLKAKLSPANLVAKSRMLAHEFLIDNTHLLRDLNIGQLTKGEAPSGEIIQDGYSAIWQLERVQKGKQVAFVDVNFKGDFYKGIEYKPVLSVGLVAFSNDSNTEKKERLDELFGMENILGLNQANRYTAGLFIARGIRDDLMKYFTT